MENGKFNSLPYLQLAGHRFLW